ncbi:MAG: ABC transporter permease [Deltaproteobacteria bacterium]|nr:MAG: ABC transporter permease [Deltaproteobacteria bacterium]
MRRSVPRLGRGRQGGRPGRLGAGGGRTAVPQPRAGVQGAAGSPGAAGGVAMSNVLMVARKELRAWFQSPVAFLFLGAFLCATMLGFFTLSEFFARNLADVRPLFEWMPVLLILLVSAITMRQWAEERARGTLEVLLTLPLRTTDLVLGKFLAGVALIALGLALTLSLPLTVSLLGDLDWGPVVGGYLGALLLGAAYLSMGLCISARTANPVVALMGTMVVGGVFYLVGHPAFTGLFGDRAAEILRAIGTGSRFESIARGVIDVRDLAYYASLAAFFLVLNVHFLELPRLDAGAESGRRRRRARLVNAALVAVNALALHAWLAPIHGLRIDMTRAGEYSLSEATERTLAQLTEPLYIDGYFSDRTHPLLAPLVPQIKDLLLEYEALGDGRVHIRFADPSADPDLEEEIGQSYGIRSVPLAVSDRNSQSVVNAFFHILVRYGDQAQVLGFDDLIEVQGSATRGLQVRLRNLEYDLTRAIRRASQDFASTESLVARLPAGSRATLYTTPDSTPAAFQDAVDDLRSVAEELHEAGLELVEEHPGLDPDSMRRLFEDKGIQPMAADLFGQERFYAQLVIEAGDQIERIVAGGDKGELRRRVDAAVRRISPGQLKTVAIFTETPEAPPRNPNLPPQFQPPTPQPDYQILERRLADEYEVRRVDLTTGEIPSDVDVLIVGKTGEMDEATRFALDQYLMRGGAVIALAGGYRVEVGRDGLEVEKNAGDLAEMLDAWGVHVGDGLVADPQNAAFPVPVQERRGPFVVNTVRMLPYPFFPDIRAGRGFDRSNPVFSSLPNVTMPWASPLAIADELPEGVRAEPLLTTSDGTWLQTDIQPDFHKWPETGFGPDGEQSARVVAVSLTGPLPSTFAGEQPPTLGQDDRAVEATLDRALDGARLTVLGSAEVVSDLMMQVAQDMAGDVHKSNLGMLANLVDWSVEDTDLLQIRRPGSFARTLVPLSDADRRRWEIGNYLVSLVGLVVVGWIGRRRSHSHRPLPALKTRAGGVA